MAVRFVCSGPGLLAGVQAEVAVVAAEAGVDALAQPVEVGSVVVAEPESVV